VEPRLSGRADQNQCGLITPARSHQTQVHQATTRQLCHFIVPVHHSGLLLYKSYSFPIITGSRYNEAPAQPASTQYEYPTMEPSDDDEFYKRLYKADDLEDEDEDERVLEFERLTSVSRARDRSSVGHIPGSSTVTRVRNQRRSGLAGARSIPTPVVVEGNSHDLPDSAENINTGLQRVYTHPQSRGSLQPTRQQSMAATSDATLPSSRPPRPPTLQKTTSAPPGHHLARTLSAMAPKGRGKGKAKAVPTPKLAPEHLQVFKGLKFCK
jgi:hypothetical protein